MNYLRSNNYTDYLFQNRHLSNNDSDSLLSYNFYIQNGGGDVDNSKPNGGFPPLFECNTNQNKKQKMKKEKTREFETKNNNNLVSIHNILEKRRNIIPFLNSEQSESSQMQERINKKSKNIKYNKINFTKPSKKKPSKKKPSKKKSSKKKPSKKKPSKKKPSKKK